MHHNCSVTDTTGLLPPIPVFSSGTFHEKKIPSHMPFTSYHKVSFATTSTDHDRRMNLIVGDYERLGCPDLPEGIIFPFLFFLLPPLSSPMEGRLFKLTTSRRRQTRADGSRRSARSLRVISLTNWFCQQLSAAVIGCHHRKCVLSSPHSWCEGGTRTVACGSRLEQGKAHDAADVWSATRGETDNIHCMM